MDWFLSGAFLLSSNTQSIYSHIHSNECIWDELGVSILPKGTSARRVEQSGIEPTFQLADDPLSPEPQQP